MGRVGPGNLRASKSSRVAPRDNSDPGPAARRDNGVVAAACHSGRLLKRSEATPYSSAATTLEVARVVFEAAPDGMVCVGAGGNILLANAEAARLFGYEPGQLDGLPLQSLIPDSARDRHEGARRHFAHTGGRRAMGAHHALFGKRRDDSLFAVDISLSTATFAEGPVIIAAVRDVTERKKVEAQLREARDELHHARSVEVLGRLAAGVAHDFNNLLTVILGLTSELELLLPEDAPLRPTVEDIADAGRRACDLTSQLLIYARRQSVAPKAVRIADVLARAERLLRRVVGSAVKLEVRVERGDWQVLADPVQLEQVVLNLAVNARQAMPLGGRLLIAARNLPDEVQGDAVVLLVADTGEGIAPATAERIFEPYFTTKGLGVGTGPPLATVRSVVSQLGGQVEVTTGPGLGAVFTVRLPRAPGSEPVPVAIGRAPRQEAVAVARCDAAERELFATALHRAGYSVHQVDTNATSELCTRLSHCDVLVTEPCLRDGVVQAMRERWPQLRLVVLGACDGGASPGASTTERSEPVRLLELLGAVSAA